MLSPFSSRAPRVFLSYSHDSQEHLDQVLSFCDQLRADGIDAWIDQYESSPPEGWPRWMEAHIREADFVLIVGSEMYDRKLRGTEGEGVGHGVLWEGTLLLQEIYSAGSLNSKYVPVLLPPAQKEHIPTALRGATFYNLAHSEEYAHLYRRLTGQQATPAPPLGKLRPMPPQKRRATQFPLPPESHEPIYLDERGRALAQDLEKAYLQLEDLESSGKETTAIREEILRIRRELRDGSRLQPGDFLANGRFKLLRELGHGGFATVWKAFDRKNLEVVAIKVLHGLHAGDRSRRDRFFRGARKMAELRHQGIVRVIEPQLEDGGYHFFVMEYVGGGDLKQAVLSGSLSVEAGLAMIIELGEALAFAHDQGVIHRDIKPDNILLDNGRPKLTDFDLVRAVDTTGGTQDGDILGTVLYTAPEALRSAEEAGVVADIYSLAMTAVFVLYQKDLPIEVLRNTESFIAALPCPPEVQNLLRWALSWVPSERPVSVSDFCRELGGFLTLGKASPLKQDALQPHSSLKQRFTMRQHFASVDQRFRAWRRERMLHLSSLTEGNLVTAINNEAQSIGTQSSIFFFVAIYIAFSAVSLRDELFISYYRLTLPFSNVSVTADWFFLAAPTLLTGLHMMILRHEYYLVEKLAALPWKKREIRKELLLSSIPISGHFGGLGFFLFWFVYLVLPLSVLVYLQMCSLRFRMPVVERGISICVAITLLASISFVIATSLAKRRNPGLWGRPFGRNAVLGGGMAALVFLSWFVASYAEMLGHPSSCDDKSRFLGIFGFRRNLVLTSTAEGGRVLNFRRMDLRCAVFAGPGLTRADFRGADLAGARFDGADLQAADFSSLLRKKTNLRDASFVRSDLTQAKFRGSSLVGADFRSANLQEANFFGADLSKARMIRANLVAADLTSSRLRGADFREALLALAQLDYASMELSRFDEAWLDRASFKGAAAFGASFRGARLRRASGLPPAGVDLQSAWVWDLRSCGDPSSAPGHINLRDLRFDPVRDWQSALEEIRAKANRRFPSSAWERMKVLLARPVGPSGPSCFSEMEWIMVAREQGWPAYLRERNVLYDKPQPGTPLEEWPALPPVTEEEYLSSLVRELIKKACAEESETLGSISRRTTLRYVLELRAREDDRFGRRLKQQLQSVSCRS